MQHCAFCGSEFPDDAKFCGRCGRAPIATLDAPTVHSGQGRPAPEKEAEEEEEQRQRALLLDLSFSPGGGGQLWVGHMPMVQGTPQVSGAPMVQGAPSSLGSAPAASATPSQPGPLSVATGPSLVPPGSSAKSSSDGSPLRAQGRKARQTGGQSGTHYAPHAGRAVATGARGHTSRWLLIALAGLVVIAAGGIALAVAGTHPSGGGPRTQAPARPVRIATFSAPTAGSALSAITRGPDGNLWFTEGGGNQIGRITPSGAITEFPLPNGGNPSGITTGPDGSLWFTEFDGEKIGRITPGGAITEFSLPAGSGNPTAITAGPDGNLWFIEPDANKIGRITG